MQGLAKYSFTANDLTGAEADDLAERISGLIVSWLTRKGASLPLQSKGSFKSKTRGNPDGSFDYSQIEQGAQQLTTLRLDEFTTADQLFETYVQVLRSEDRVEVYASLSAQSMGASVSPLVIQAKCPRIVSDIIAASPSWSFNGQSVPTALRRATGETDGQRLAEHIQSASRVHPIVVASDLDGEELLPELCEKLAYELEGLAHVYSIDDDASWELSSELGKLNSCYLGAVRLYWPKTAGSDKLYSSVWTASKLLPQDEGLDVQARDRFLGQMRQRVLGTAAEALIEPASMGEFRRQLNRQTADAAQEERSATEETDELRRINEALEAKLAAAQVTISRLHTLLREAQSDDDGDSVGIVDAAEGTKPKPGDVRFYKKTLRNARKGADHDSLARISDCGHTSWQSANKADKAKKGIMRLEGTSAWSQVQHCGSCTGGGVWRVKW